MSLNINSLKVKVGAFALDIEELHVGPGEIMGLLGKSGSGKSTLLTALGGFLPGTTGEYRIDGEDRSHFFPERRRLAYVFQKSSLFPHLTLAKNVAFPLQIAGVKARADGIDLRVAALPARAGHREHLAAIVFAPERRRAFTREVFLRRDQRFRDA